MSNLSSYITNINWNDYEKIYFIFSNFDESNTLLCSDDDINEIQYSVEKYFALNVTQNSRNFFKYFYEKVYALVLKQNLKDFIIAK